jgi:hypothetical protein
MKKNSGVVLEVHAKTLVVVTPEGEFLKMPHPGGIIKPGQIIVTAVNRPYRWNLIAGVSLFVVAALFALIIFPSVNFLGNNQELAHGYLSFDLNPSLELIYDQNLNVTAVKTFNKEADLLVQDLVLERNLYNLLETLVERSYVLGYFDSEKQPSLIMISYVQPAQHGIDESLLLKALQEKVEQLNLVVAFSLAEVDRQVRENAVLAGLSVNNYMLKQALGVAFDEETALPENLTSEQIVVLLENKYPEIKQKLYLPNEKKSEEANSDINRKQGPPDHANPGPPGGTPPGQDGKSETAPPDHANPGSSGGTPPGQDKANETGPPGGTPPGQDGKSENAPPDHANPDPPGGTPPGQDKDNEPGPPGGTPPGQDGKSENAPPDHANPGPPDGVPPGQGPGKETTPPGQESKNKE